jgi:hypothetical protein
MLSLHVADKRKRIISLETSFDYSSQEKLRAENHFVNNIALLNACTLAFMQNFLTPYDGIGLPRGL